MQYFSLKWGLLSLGLIILGTSVVFLKLHQPVQTTPTLRIGEKSWTIIGVADTSALRTQGLAYRDSLEPGSGLLFTFPEADKYGFWMKGMRFPLDIIFIRQGMVDSIARNRLPEDLTPILPEEPVTEVFEVNAGEALGVEPGQIVQLSQ